jgi:hypothetical protein
VEWKRWVAAGVAVWGTLASAGGAELTNVYPQIRNLKPVVGNDSRVHIGNYFRIELGDITIYNDSSGIYGVKNHKTIWSFDYGCVASKNNPVIIGEDYFGLSCSQGTTTSVYAFWSIDSGDQRYIIRGRPILQDSKYFYYINTASGNWPVAIYKIERVGLKGKEIEVSRFFLKNIPKSCDTRDNGGYDDIIKDKLHPGKYLEFFIRGCGFQVFTDLYGNIVKGGK